MNKKTYYNIFIFFTLYFISLSAQELESNIDTLLARSERLILSYKYEEGITNADKALKIAIKNNDSKKTGDAFYYIANGYLGLQKHRIALDYFDKSLELKNTSDNMVTNKLVKTRLILDKILDNINSGDQSGNKLDLYSILHKFD